jgi:hypothetical protein
MTTPAGRDPATPSRGRGFEIRSQIAERHDPAPQRIPAATQEISGRAFSKRPRPRTNDRKMPKRPGRRPGRLLLTQLAPRPTLQALVAPRCSGAEVIADRVAEDRSTTLAPGCRQRNVSATRGPPRMTASPGTTTRRRAPSPPRTEGDRADHPGTRYRTRRSRWSMASGGRRDGLLDRDECRAVVTRPLDSGGHFDKASATIRRRRAQGQGGVHGVGLQRRESPPSPCGSVSRRTLHQCGGPGAVTMRSAPQMPPLRCRRTPGVGSGATRPRASPTRQRSSMRSPFSLAGPQPRRRFCGAWQSCRDSGETAYMRSPILSPAGRP